MISITSGDRSSIVTAAQTLPALAAVSFHTVVRKTNDLYWVAIDFAEYEVSMSLL